MKKISLVVPMYNEEKSIPLFFDAVDKVISSLPNYEFEIVAVNDGSKDSTLEILKSEYEKRNNLVVVNLSRNWGQEQAIRAGLLNASGDCAIPMDADRQDPPEVIPLLVEQWENGFEVVNARRSSRKKDSSFKRNSAGIYYKILGSFDKKIKIPDNVANFRLVDRKVLDAINNLPEKNRVFRIQVPFVGFKTCEVLFERPSRKEGESKYPLKSMVNLALNSATSLSAKPLVYPLRFGIAFGVLGFLSLLVELVLFILVKCDVMFIDDFSLIIWLVVSIFTIFFSIVLDFLGLMGIYIGSIANEVKGRPAVIIDEVFKK